MSQVLEKPILLDETGQAIAGKLDTNADAIVDMLEEIKDAIGTSSEFIPVKIQVVTPPTKTIYKVGETLDLTGMVVNLVGTNGVQIDVTSACTFSPANGATLTTSDTTVTVTYLYQHDNLTFTTTQALTIRELTSIAVTTLPTKTAYKANEDLDLTGVVVTATYDDGATANVTADCTFNPADGTGLTTSDTTVTVTLVEGSITKTTSFSITVIELVSIAITNPPNKTAYHVGEQCDLTGIQITATYSDNSTADVTSNCRYDPTQGTYLYTPNTNIKVTYSEIGTIQRAYQPITVTYPIYGVYWDGSSDTTWIRTDGAEDFSAVHPYTAAESVQPYSPFDEIMPWSGMEIVDDATVGKLVSIPKFYYKITQTENTHDLKIQISSDEMEGFSVSPAHMDRGDGEGERDVVYVSRYHIANNESISGHKPDTNTRSGFRTAIHNEGAEYWQWDFAMWFTIWLLYIVEFADWDSQTVIGHGGGTTLSYHYTNNGYTDLMPYHTGTVESSVDTVAPSTQYRHIEGLWENVMDWLDGCWKSSSNVLFIVLNPTNFSDSSPTGKISTGIQLNNIDGYPSQFSVVEVNGLFPLILPTDTSGSASTYCCDNWQQFGLNSYTQIMQGSNASVSDGKSGIFALWARSSDYSSYVGSRIMKLPVTSQ